MHLVLSIALLLNGLALLLPGWSRGNSTSVGLWRKCAHQSDTGLDYCFDTRLNPPPAVINYFGALPNISVAAARKLVYCRAALVTSFLLLLICLALHGMDHGKLAAALLIIAALLSLSVLVVWASDKSLGMNKSLGQRLGMTWFIQLLSFLLLVIAIIWCHKDGGDMYSSFFAE